MHDRVLGPVVRSLPRSVGKRYSKQLAARSQESMVALRDFILTHPDVVTTIVEALDDRSDVDSRQDLALGWIMELLWQYQIAQQSISAGSALVLDEGFCNRALTLFGYQYSAKNEPLLKKYIDAIPKPDLVVVVSGDPEVMAARGSHGTRFGYFTHEQAVQYMKDVEVCVAKTSELLEQRGVAVRLVRNDGQSTAEASMAVRTVVRTWVDGRALNDEAEPLRE